MYRSDHFDGVRFFNPWGPFNNSLWSVLWWKLTSKPIAWPDEIPNVYTDEPPARVEGDEVRVSFVGQATVLIQTQGLNLITDPIWSDYASPLKSSRTKRAAKPGIAFEKLPKIDLVLLSHNHYDHLDLPTLQRLWQRDAPKMITLLGNDAIVRSFDPEIEVLALDWWQSVKVSDVATVHVTAAQHWSGRSFWDHNRALWGGFVIETPSGKLYFAGDTGYCDVFRQVRERFGEIQFAMLPIGTYEPRWFMKYNHMNPEDAVLAWEDLGLPKTLGIHFGTFKLGDEGLDDPVKDLTIAKQRHHSASNLFRTLNIGESWTLNQG